MADKKKKLSTADILAAARKKDGAGGGEAEAAPDESPPAAEASADPAEKQATPSAAKALAAKPAERPSVAEMLAMARAGKGSGGRAEPAAKPAAAKPKAAVKPAAAKADKPASGKDAAAAPKDTASILAAARGAAKPGPMSKAEAAAKGQTASAKTKPTAPPMPVKPAYAKPVAKQAAEGEQRRSFLGIAVGVLFGSMFAIGNTAMAATAGLWTLSLARFMFPNVLAEPPTLFKVGFPSDFPAGSVATKFKAQFGVWVVNGDYKGTSSIYALKTVCTHLGCTPNWLEGEQKFKCPCHGSGFYKDGINFEGPAPRPLERYAIRLADDGQIEVDKSIVFFEEKGEWSNSSSFVEV